VSTKCSVAYGPDFHLYREVFDDEHIYLQLEGVAYEASSQQVMVSIPMRIWEVIRRRGGARLSYAEKTDPEIQAEVEEWVDERLARYHEAQESGGGGMIAFAGCFVIGTADDPREEQIAQGIAYYQQMREQQQQLKKAIEELEQANKDKEL